MNTKRQAPVGIRSLLEGDKVRRVDNPQGQARYAAIDVVAVLGDPEHPERLWDELKYREPQLQYWIEHLPFPTVRGRPKTSEGLSLDGLLRLIQSISSPRAERLKSWLSHSAAEHLRESANPEMLALRARKLYEQRGYSRRWVDKRLRGISARHELTGEWYHRGAVESDQFRTLTNRLMRRAFGMDVESYRRYKNLTGANENLRDHMSDLELALTSLAETTAVALHQARNSHGAEQLQADADDAGRIVAQTRRQIEKRSGRTVVNPGNHLQSGPRRRRAELADKATDMHNPSPSHPVRTVA